ncbi:hypothetical protein PTTG_10485 [Puccinia triticina 1-1 BBBD Race 1]|uniref:ANK_REP_REGION domain-containing protein n=2 Tax=Puccinia triticina TaxID=208348 RepID=A0A180G2T7_PUCT1|nr:uncharacterized protein PtA15_11A679 [Puccinia triticina]OAV86920.1 hypothetical protein PTTG_10485 [Puccinia triticina 1-1 BBBD Race 1]WAQ89987.1 hypothetical protein PtA15_11A679 [Puccinia triticina]WAR60026.1 hypothetical protein PtB15_11B668 [Puccinia triticina]
MPTLLSLPIEILHDIHLLSTSEHLPIICKQLLHVYSRTTSARYRALFLWRKYVLKEAEDAQRPLERNSDVERRSRAKSSSGGRERRKKVRWDAILATPACSMEVLQILRGFYSDPLPSDPPEIPKIKIPALPTRLFKALSSKPSDDSTADDHTDELEQAFRYIDLLLTDYGTSPDKLGGYPLARSVLSGNLAFIRLLLDHGARPAIKDNLVIMVAIETGDLELLRLLVEPAYIHPDESRLPLTHCCLNKNTPDSSNHKKLKLEDRVQITDQMLEKAIKRRHAPMARYFIERGARPTLETIRMIECLQNI